MTDATTRIRNLSIAFAAVAENGHLVSTADRILSLLQDEITKAERKIKAKASAPPAATTSDDNIPF